MRKYMTTTLLTLGLIALASCQCASPQDISQTSSRIQLPSTINKVKDSTVMIRLIGGGGGSGIVIDSNTILTCYHVVKGQKIVMVYQYGVVCTGEVTKIDPKRDLAIVKLSLPLSTKGTKLSTKKVTIGDKVIASGHPFLKPLYLSFGVIGALDKEYLIHNTAINGGNSGGGLYDSNGDLVGMNAMIITPNGVWCGMSISIRVEVLRDFLKK